MNLSDALREKGVVEGDVGVLTEALAVGRAAVEGLAGDDPEVPGLLSNVGLVLRERFLLTGAEEDLRETVELSRAGAEQLAEEHPYWAGRMLNLGIALRHLYEHTGDVGALGECVAAHRAALRRLDAGDAAVGRCASGLSAALRRLYLRHGDSGELDEAIEAARVAVGATARGHRRESTRRLNLGGALLTRYERTRVAGDLAEAMAEARQAYDAALPGGPAQADAASLLGLVLQREGERTGDAGRLRESVALARAGVAQARPGEPDRARHLVNLASALLAEYDRTGAEGVLREATRTYDEAIAATPPADSRWADRLLDRGRAYARSHRVAARPDALASAYKAFDAAGGSSSGTPSVRIHAYRAKGRLAGEAGQWGVAAEAYAAALALLPLAAPRHLARADREYGLSDTVGLASEAAAAALAAGDAELAVVLLEEGRGVILGEEFATRDGLRELDGRSAELAREVRRVRALLNDPVTDDLSAPSGGDRRRDLSARWTALVERARAVPGLEGLFGRPTFDEIKGHAAEGPVVLLNAAEHRSDALVLTRDGVRVVPLPGVTLTEAVRRATEFLTATDTTAVAGPAPGDAATGGDVREDAIRGTLRWLWETVVGPVLGTLDLAGTPRVWWCPTGVLTYLPFHAAGPEQGPSALDLVVSSYTPTVRALGHTRTERPEVPVAPLAVSLPRTPGARDLPGAVLEVRILRNLLPGTKFLTGAKATRGAVLKKLPRYGYAHFACHGVSDARRPSDSRLLLADGPLTVADLIRLDLRNGRLAVLLACRTTRTAPDLPDEAVHIAGAFLLAGYAQVVGTLWSLNDLSAVTLTGGLYSAPADPSGSAARALRRAVLKTRATFPGRPSHWAAAVHVGA
ncbi:CHAT domain-containing protein [Sphaerisporangium aureirubrum]|uniref:CHAT domain-containing protein n=1 Tax=Sphaerisporangium aureirubrum TaxID=1544736 RepID=A0ABW1NIP4_9ACTN